MKDSSDILPKKYLPLKLELSVPGLITFDP